MNAVGHIPQRISKYHRPTSAQQTFRMTCPELQRYSGPAVEHAYIKVISVALIDMNVSADCSPSERSTHYISHHYTLLV